MKKLIRKGVFETNSSSSHSISVASSDKEFVLDTLYPDQHGTIIVRGDEYGWDWFKHNDAETKASYAAQSFSEDKDMLEKLEYVIKEQTGAERVIFEDLNDGYIDHDSYGIVPRTAGELKNFIFNKNSWLFGGNDNSEASPEFYIVPEYKGGRMVMPEFKFELVIEGLKETSKFLNQPTDEELESAISSLIRDAMLNENGQFIVDDSIMWQITRPRNVFYEYGNWKVQQDFSTGEIRFIKEGSNESWDIENRLKEEGKFEGVDWGERSKIITEELLKIPGLIKTVKFTVKEI